MKRVSSERDKSVSAIIATILLIAITVVLAATLVAILGGFTHSVGRKPVIINGQSEEIGSTSPVTHFVVFFNITTSSENISSGNVMISFNGGKQLSLETVLEGNCYSCDNPPYLNGGSTFKFTQTNFVNSFDLIFRGNVIYSSGTVPLKSVKLETISATVNETNNGNDYVLYFNVTSSTFKINTADINVTYSGGTESLSSILNTYGGKYQNPTFLNTDSDFTIEPSGELPSFSLKYDGDIIYASGQINIT